LLLLSSKPARINAILIGNSKQKTEKKKGKK
jgi:hypothetical protein